MHDFAKALQDCLLSLSLQSICLQFTRLWNSHDSVVNSAAVPAASCNSYDHWHAEICIYVFIYILVKSITVYIDPMNTSQCKKYFCISLFCHAFPHPTSSSPEQRSPWIMMVRLLTWEPENWNSGPLNLCFKFPILSFMCYHSSMGAVNIDKQYFNVVALQCAKFT